jgi:predicted porin
MKKTLIAVAALVATGAFAQSTVQIDGLVDVGLTNQNIKGAAVVGFDRGMSGTTQFNLRGNSDLGGGMNATFRVETDFNPAQNSANTGFGTNISNGVYTANTAATANAINPGGGGTFGNGELTAGLNGSFGNVRIGAPNALGLDAAGTIQPFGTAWSGGYGVTVRAKGVTSSAAASSAGVRYDNSIRYDSPVFAGGLIASYVGRKQNVSASALGNSQYSTTLGVQQQSGVSELGLRYSAGPLNAVLSRVSEDARNVTGCAYKVPTTDTTLTCSIGNLATLTTLGANYNLGAVTVYGGLQYTKATDPTSVLKADQNSINLAAKYAFGVNTVLASYGRQNDSIKSLSTTNFGLGYEYALSKTTSLVARFQRYNDNAGIFSTTGLATVTGNTTVTRMGMGFRTAF